MAFITYLLTLTLLKSYTTANTFSPEVRNMSPHETMSGVTFGYKNFEVFYSTYLNVSSIKVVNHEEIKNCLADCVRDKQCISVNSEWVAPANHHRCSLLATDKYHFPNNESSNSNFNYYTIVVGPFCFKESSFLNQIY